MANTPRIGWPKPPTEPSLFIEGFDAFADAQDATAYASREDRNILPMGGGTFAFDATTGVLSWSAAIELSCSIPGVLWTVPAGNVTLSDGSFFYVSLVRGATQNTSVTAQVSSRIPSNDDAYVLGIRRGDRVYFRNNGVIADAEAFALLSQTTAPTPGVDEVYNEKFVNNTSYSILLNDDDYQIICTSAPGTPASVTLPPASTATGRVYKIRNTLLSTEVVTINTTIGDGVFEESGETATSRTIAPGQSISLGIKHYVDYDVWRPISQFGTSTLAGDATGPLTSSTVVALRGRTLDAASVPTTGDVLAWNGTSIIWKEGFTRVNIKDFGAVGDDVANDTAAIQSAIDAVNALGGGSVFFPVPSVAWRIQSKLRVYSNVTLVGETKGWSSGSLIKAYGGITAIGANDPTGITRHVKVIDLTINNSGAAPASSIGIDFAGVSWSEIKNVSLRNHEKGIYGFGSAGGGGYYNDVSTCEIASCTTGIWLAAAANAYKILGGRISGNTTGIYSINNTGNYFNTTCEANTTAMRFATGCAGHLISGTYFEGNNPGNLANNGAIVFESGASNNTEFGNMLSNGTDVVLDLDGRNRSLSFNSTAPSGSSDGVNLLTNPDFDIVGPVAGIAQGWSMDPSVPAGTTLSIDTVEKPAGAAASQKYEVNATSERVLARTVKTVIGQRYTLTGWIHVTSASAFRLEFGTAAGTPTAYGFVTPVHTNQWLPFRQTFIAVGTELYLGLHILTAFVGGAHTARIAKFKLEPGLFPTDFSGETLLSKSTDVGPALASAGTLAITHAIHRVTGTTAINTITVPKGFAGSVILVPTAGWSLTTAGNIANAVTAVPNTPVLLAYDPTTDKWYASTADGGRKVFSARSYGLATGNTRAQNKTAMDAATAAAVAAGGGVVHIEPGTYQIDPFLLPDKVSLDGDGQGVTILDGSSATTWTDATLIKAAGSTTEVGAISTVAADASAIVVATGAGTFAPGDVGIIFNDTNSSFSAARTYYRAGEFFRVKSVSGTTLNLTEPLYAGYTAGANMHVYRITPVRVSVSNMTLIGPGTAYDVQGLTITHGVDCNVRNVEFRQFSLGCLTWDRCYDFTQSHVRTFESATLNGGNYGAAILNCQRWTITNSHLVAGRHGLAIGGGSSNGCVPNRDGMITSSIISSNSNGVDSVNGADMHGNCEHIYYQNCRLPRGVQIAGDHTGILNCEIDTGTNSGAAILATELLGMDHVIQGNIIRARMAIDASYGLVNVTSGTTTIARAGGCLTVRDNKIVAGAYSGTLVYVYYMTGGTQFDVSVDVSGNVATYTGAQSAGSRLTVRADTGLGFRRVTMDNNRCFGVGLRMDGVNSEFVSACNNAVVRAAGSGIEKYKNATQIRTQEQVSAHGNRIREAYECGLLLQGESKTFSVIDAVGNTSLNNGIIAAGDSSIRSSMYLTNAKTARSVRNLFGDDQAVPVQVRVAAYYDITTLIHDNDRVGDDLTTNMLSITTELTGYMDRTNKLRMWDTAAPASGTWNVGDQVWNRTPTATGIAFWICTTAGTPGTWTPIYLAGLNGVSTIPATLATPLISQSDLTTNSGTGQTFTLQAQNATGTTSNGGKLTLKSGTGTTAAGTVEIRTGSTLNTTFTGTGFATVGTISAPLFNAGAAGDTVIDSVTNTVLKVGNVTKFYCASALNVSSQSLSVTGTTTSTTLIATSAATKTNPTQGAFDGGSTTNATPTAAGTITIPDNDGGIIFVQVTATKDDGTVVFNMMGKVAFAKNSGTLTINSPVYQSSADAALDSIGTVTGMTFTLTSSSNNIAVTVTGLAATTFRWAVSYQFADRVKAA